LKVEPGTLLVQTRNSKQLWELYHIIEV
jgi:hypothetical protein